MSPTRRRSPRRLDVQEVAQALKPRVRGPWQEHLVVVAERPDTSQPVLVVVVVGGGGGAGGGGTAVDIGRSVVYKQT